MKTNKMATPSHPTWGGSPRSLQAKHLPWISSDLMHPYIVLKLREVKHLPWISSDLMHP